MSNMVLIYDAFQYAMVGALVSGCAIYCVLALAPNAIKGPLEDALRRLPLLGRILRKQNQPRTAGACGATCGGCNTSPTTVQKISWHPRRP